MLKRRKTFPGGVHPLASEHSGKSITMDLPIEVMPAGKVLQFSCSQHIGAPAKPIVKKGDYVRRGQLIAEPTAFVSAGVHASVSGMVRSVGAALNKLGKTVQVITVENDFKDELAEEIQPMKPLYELTPEEILAAIKASGNVGMGGAGFPTHAKMSIPEGKKVDVLIMNGAECEPFLTSDYRLMVEQPEHVIFGMKAIMKALLVNHAYLAIEDNKPLAIAALQKASQTMQEIEVVPLKTKYPQGSEKQIIEAVCGRQVPQGGLPVDVGAVVVNSASAAALASKILHGMPTMERIVTVTGCINHPKNVLVRIGTPVQEVIDFCGGIAEGAQKIILGGPMMGIAITEGSTSLPITKTDGAILALHQKYCDTAEPQNCINCGRCHTTCPMHLMPMDISAAALKGDWRRAEDFGALDCLLCGCCSYVCPAKRHITQSIRLAKDEIAALRAGRR